MADFFDSLHVSDLAERAHDIGPSRAFLASVIVQVMLIAVLYLAAWGLRALIRPWIERGAVGLRAYRPALVLLGAWDRLEIFFFAWLLLVLAARMGPHLGLDAH